METSDYHACVGLTSRIDRQRNLYRTTAGGPSVFNTVWEIRINMSVSLTTGMPFCKLWLCSHGRSEAYFTDSSAEQDTGQHRYTCRDVCYNS